MSQAGGVAVWTVSQRRAGVSTGGRRPVVAAILLLLLSGMCVSGQALSWKTEKTHRVAAVQPVASARNGFTLLAPDKTGVRFTNHLSYDRSEANQNLLNGAGVAAGDFDGDGWCDLYFCNLEGSNALFRNLGNWQFTNVTSSAGVGGEHQTSRGAVFADVNGDDRLDLLVSSLSGPNCFYLNLGEGRFTNVTTAAGVVSKPLGGHSITLGDIDGDRDLDIYLANYGENSLLRSGGAVSVRTVNGKPVIRGKQAQRLKIIDGLLIEFGEPHALYLNNGNGSFTAVSWTDGTFLDEAGKPLSAAPADMGLSAMFRDINADGAPDLYVCNDFQTPDRIWINNGRGRFSALPPRALRSTPHFSMGVDFADIDRDGDDDFFVGDMLSRSHVLRMRQVGATNPPASHVEQAIDREQFRRNGLFLNRGDHTYAEIANFAGVDASDWSWSVVFLDVDLDGYEDLLVANGHAYDTQDMDMDEKRPVEERGAMRTGKSLKDFPPLRTPNVAFRNRGDRTFEELGKTWGFNSDQVSHGIALADLDNDGDQDVVVSCLWQAPLLYRNEGSGPRVAVQLRGLAPNTRGIGAKIRLRGGPKEQSQEMISGGRYLAGDAPLRTFAAVGSGNSFSLEVTWRTGQRTVVSNVMANAIYEIFESAAQPTEPRAVPPAVAPLFQDMSALLAYRHEDVPAGDFESQPLLHKYLSRGGPGVGWVDIDGQGDDELVISGGRGRLGTTGVFRFDGKESSERWMDKIWLALSKHTFTTPLSFSGPNGVHQLLLGVASYEPVVASPGIVLLESKSGQLQQIASPRFTSLSNACVGPVAVADVDGDQDLDVFIGGKMIPGRYPEPAPSFLLRNNAGVLEADAVQNRLFQKTGLVNGAVFSDLDGDGLSELVLACEWGPVRVWQNKGGKFTDATEALGLAGSPGWWNGVTTGDVDGDGKIDIVASNWGWNSGYGGREKTALQLVYGDFDNNGTVDLVEAYQPAEAKSPLPRRDMRYMSRGLPLLRTRFASHQAYAAADLAGVVGTAPDKFGRTSATTLANTCFLNRGGRFEAVTLPDEAQFAPAFGVNVADFDGDGKEDVFLAQNFFAMRPEEPRLDAGRGLLLRGLGTGRFETVPGHESGILVYGEQRGSAVGDFNRDGRPDLALAQHRGEAILLRNSGARPGLRVRLAGPPGNPEGIGAVIRVRFASGYGPAREVHGGSGYWSQDSVIPVMATPQPPQEISVRWPGGTTTTHPVPPDAQEITVAMKGGARAEGK